MDTPGTPPRAPSGAPHSNSSRDEAETPLREGGGSVTLALVGNPNVGKSVVFHWLTGRYVTVSNYPGTTVEVTRGRAVLPGGMAIVYDTPGLNSLLAGSEDERVTRRVLLEREEVTVIQVADAKNLERALALTLELAEAELPAVLVLNMIDEARERRIAIAHESLGRELGIPVIPTIATQRWGLAKIPKAVASAKAARAKVRYGAVLGSAVEAVAAALPSGIRGRRAWAVLWLCGEPEVEARVRSWVPAEQLPTLIAQRAGLARHSGGPVSVWVNEARLRTAHELAAGVLRTEPLERRAWRQHLGDLALHPLWGSAAAVAVLWLMYQFVGVFGAQVLVGWFEETLFGKLINPAVSLAAERLLPWAWLRDLIAGEYGLVTMALTYSIAIILPIVGTFFLCFGLLEDSGYLPRLAALCDRACRTVGLNGKAVLPLVLGLGCGTMATMTTRTLEHKREQMIVMILLALAIPCSAQLGVIMAMMGSLPAAAALIWAAVVAASFIAAGQAASRIVGGEPSPFVYELPPLRRPKLSNIALKTVSRIEWYLREAVPLFVLGTLVLFLTDRAGLLLRLERALAPLVVSWLGLPAQAATMLVVGFLRRDFGAAGLFALHREGLLAPEQTLVSLIVITLFVPCLAQFLMMAKERGWAAAAAIASSVVAYAFLVGGVVRWLLVRIPLV